MMLGIPALIHGLLCLVVRKSNGYYQGLIWSRVTGDLWDTKDSFNTLEDAEYWCRMAAADCKPREEANAATAAKRGR